MVDKFIKIKIERPSLDKYDFALGSFKYEGNLDGLKDLILENIIDSYKKAKNEDEWKTLSNENHFTDLLVEKLRKKSLFIYCLIINRESQEGIYTEVGYPDIKINIPTSGRYFDIECKKLDEKTNKNSLRQKYIDEGLSRFIDGKYAEEEDFGGMIGYVIKGDIIDTYSDMKKRVKNYHYVLGKEYLLNKSCVNCQGSFQSEHSRKNDLGSIHIYHLFFDFENKKNNILKN